MPSLPPGPHLGNWELIIDSFDGYAPAYWMNVYTSKGNRGHASAMQNVDMIDPNILTQGPGLADLTNGNQDGVVTTLIRQMMPVSIDGTNIYGGGGNLLYKINETTVVSDGTWPHTIDKAAVTDEDFECIVPYNNGFYYAYNHSGTLGDIGYYDGSTFDDDYMSTVPTGAGTLIGGVPHQAFVGGDNSLYIMNGNYIARFIKSSTTFDTQALDLPVGEVIASGVWNQSRVIVGSNKPNFTSNYQQDSSVYVWDTFSSSWEYQIRVHGRIGALYAKGGVTYIWYQDISTDGVYKLGFINGTEIQDLAFFTGTMPIWSQISEDRNHLQWVSGGKVNYFGAVVNNIPTKFFNLASGGYDTSGGISNAFGTPIIASHDDGTNYRLAQFSGYTVDAFWNSVLFNVSNGRVVSQMDRVTIDTEPVAAGAKLDTTLTCDYGASTKVCQQISGDATPGKTRHIIVKGQFNIANFRIDLSWANGSTTNPVKVRRIIINGSFSTQS